MLQNLCRSETFRHNRQLFGCLWRIDARHRWTQQEIVPTLWHVADLGTKWLTRKRRELLIFLIGVMEISADGKEETFSQSRWRAEFSSKAGKEDFGKTNEQDILEQTSSWRLHHLQM